MSDIISEIGDCIYADIINAAFDNAREKLVAKREKEAQLKAATQQNSPMRNFAGGMQQSVSSMGMRPLPNLNRSQGQDEDDFDY